MLWLGRLGKQWVAHVFVLLPRDQTIFWYSSMGQQNDSYFPAAKKPTCCWATWSCGPQCSQAEVCAMGNHGLELNALRFAWKQAAHLVLCQGPSPSQWKFRRNLSCLEAVHPRDPQNEQSDAPSKAEWCPLLQARRTAEPLSKQSCQQRLPPNQNQQSSWSYFVPSDGCLRKWRWPAWKRCFPILRRQSAPCWGQWVLALLWFSTCAQTRKAAAQHHGSVPHAKKEEWSNQLPANASTVPLSWRDVLQCCAAWLGASWSSCPVYQHHVHLPPMHPDVEAFPG